MILSNNSQFSANNQGIGGNVQWKNFHFRSCSEAKIAMELDRRGVLFLPNSKVCLTHSHARKILEPDFLVCYKGKWGILEVDGEPWHPASRAVHDHKRDRLFKAQGILTVEHFDASECYQEKERVVDEFLNILEYRA